MIKVFLKGPLLAQGGYPTHARFVFRALRKRLEEKGDIDLYVLPTSWGQLGWLSEDSEERQYIDQLVAKTYAYNKVGGKYDLSIQVTIPNEWQKLADVNIGVTAGIETTKVAPQWIEKSFVVDRIVVPSNHSKETYFARKIRLPSGEEISCQTPIEVIPYPVRAFDPANIVLDFETDFNFLVAAQIGPRKNVQSAIVGFIEEFHERSDVGLVIKGSIKNNSIIDRFHTETGLQDFVKSLDTKFPNKKCKIYLLHGDMTDEEMSALYQHPKIKCLVSMAHGEGFGLFQFEAAYYGLPIIAPDWSGYVDFLYMPIKDKKTGNVKNKAMFGKIGYDLKDIQKEVVWEGVLPADSKWAYPLIGSYRTLLRDVYEDVEKYQKQALKLKDYIRVTHEENKINDLLSRILIDGPEATKKEIDGISFCIPTNGKRPIKTKQLIKSIQKQSAAIPFEIILCGNVDALEPNDDERIVWIEATADAMARKVAKLRNIAANSAKYDTICFCDDDMLLEPDWLEKMNTYSKDNEWDVVGCKILNPDGTRHWDRCTLNPHKLVDYSYPAISRNLYQSSGLLLIRKSAFRKNNWDETKLVYADRLEGQIPEDIKFSIDLTKAGYVLKFNSEATVWHSDDSYTEYNEQTINKQLLTTRGIKMPDSQTEKYMDLVKLMV